jgi:hypothetical protein
MKKAGKKIGYSDEYNRKIKPNEDSHRSSQEMEETQ